jgi:hypothetical protein
MVMLPVEAVPMNQEKKVHPIVADHPYFLNLEHPTQQVVEELGFEYPTLLVVVERGFARPTVLVVEEQDFGYST